MRNYILLSIIISSFLISIRSYSQDTVKISITVSGNTVNLKNGGKLEKVHISAFQDSVLLSEVCSNNKGEYSITFETTLDQNVDIIYQKEEFVSKMIRFTQDEIGCSEVLEGTEIDIPNISVTFFAESKSRDYEFLKTEPVGVFRINCSKLTFEIDLDHQNQMKKKVDDYGFKVEKREIKYVYDSIFYKGSFIAHGFVKSDLRDRPFDETGKLHGVLIIHDSVSANLTHIEYKHGVKSGVYMITDSTGSTIYYGHYLDGKRNGHSQMMRNKQIIEVGTWSEGEKDDTWVYYDDNGIITKTEIYKRGKLIKTCDGECD